MTAVQEEEANMTSIWIRRNEIVMESSVQNKICTWTVQYRWTLAENYSSSQGVCLIELINVIDHCHECKMLG